MKTTPVMTSSPQNPGQNHDTLRGNQALSSPAILTMDKREADVVEITASQRMISATSGSLLTSLLVTPLDVVRVRWQSQSIRKPSPISTQPLSANLQKLAAEATNTFKAPSNLGVTACCREVFFTNGNAEFCLAGPQLEGVAGVTMQANASLKGAECAVEQAQKKAFTSTFDGMRKITRDEGFFTLWRGLSPTLLMAVPANIIYFTGYDWLRYNKSSPIAKLTKDPYTPLVAGSVSRIIAATAVSPIELFRTRLQATSGASAVGHLAETFKGVQDMVTHQGYRSLWRGIGLTLWRDVPFSGIYWWGYESVRNKLVDAREKHDHLPLEYEGSTARARRRFRGHESQLDTFFDSFVAGATSGAIASIVTMPFDVGKTRTQLHRNTQPASKASRAAVASSAPEDLSMVRLLWHIFQTEGAAGLWRGWVPRTLKVAPACAIMISSYEVGKRAFRTVNENSNRQDDGGV